MTETAEDRERLEMRRMLAWFRQQLPAHDVSVWSIEVQPLPPRIVVESSDDHRSWLAKSTRWQVVGMGCCARCRRTFPIPGMGNAYAYDEGHIPATVAEMRAWVLRDAERAGPCWGDVPFAPDDDRSSAAVLDGAR